MPARSSSTRAIAAITALAGSAAVLVTGAAAPQAPGSGPMPASFAVAVAPAGRGEVPRELEVLVDGRRVEGVERLESGVTGPLRVVLYLDYPSARPASVQALATALIDQSESLAALPGLEIVEADPDPRPMQRWRSREELEQSLSRLTLRGLEDDEVARLRRDFVASLEPPGNGAGGRAAPSSPARDRAGDDALASPRVLAQEAYALEVAARRERRDALVAWLAAQGRSESPRLLLLLDDNLDLDPAAFYRSRVPASEAPELRAMSSDDVAASTAAAYGWTVLPIVPDPAEAERRLRYAPSADTPVGFRLGLGRRRDPAAAPVDDLGLSPGATGAADRLARLTGGERVADLTELSQRIAAFGARPVLRFTVPDLAPGTPAQLAVRGGGGAELLAPSLVATGTPAEVSALRARRAIAGESVEGGLVVRSAIEFDPETLAEEPSGYEARVDLADLRERRPGLERGSFRVTLAVHLESEEVLVMQELAPEVAFDGLDEWLFRGSLRLPPSTDGAVVLVDLLETGDWGDSFAAFVRRRITSRTPAGPDATAAPGTDGGVLPGARMVRLIGPERSVVYGKARIRAEVDRRVRRLIYLLDGKRIATRRGAPWDVELDLGSDPQQRLVVAIAYGPGDVELGRDGILLNDATRGFAVRIVEPRPSRRVGPVDVQADVDVPLGGTVDRVEFYWLDQLVATARRPPYRQRIPIPVSSGAGFIRVTARLTDGRLAEDVVMMNADRFEAEVTVNLVELYVVVTDRSGKPVRDLAESDFSILEEGRPQRIESFARAGDLPITIGLALDSSLSLFLKMPALRDAAADFVDGLVDSRDQAFLVGFGSRPTVVRATTGDLGRVVEGIRSLEPTGNTALWEGVVLSMIQLREIAGRKALVVFYDGDDEDEDFSFTTSLKMAERVGVPVYLIVMNNALARTGPSGFTTKHRAERLERMARTGGGKVFYVSTEADLGDIFTAIRDELRSHYLLTYYPTAPPVVEGEGGAAGQIPRWRPIEVRVDKPGLEARTLAGYEKL